ncbi:hypothetical protein [Intrasporangium sp. YIM S08009]|uniref:hypothetical protein n=1 Tax=Intrasporangium zincisolvens TaxID=3080018 RepID=UPI002B05C0B7|nr:hypothetical protein [Intrasporangium sp. YIM S08009]
MFAPRWLIAAGIALIAVSLGAAGHGLWWLVGLVFVLGHRGRRWDACAHQGRRDHRDLRDLGDRHDRGQDAGTPPVAQPDPTHDRHEAFPQR